MWAKSKKIQAFALSSKVGGPGMPAQNHRFHTNSKMTKIEDLTWRKIDDFDQPFPPTPT